MLTPQEGRSGIAMTFPIRTELRAPPHIHFIQLIQKAIVCIIQMDKLAFKMTGNVSERMSLPEGDLGGLQFYFSFLSDGTGCPVMISA